MRVVFIETKGSVYGGQKQLLARCAEFDRRGIQYTVIHPFTDSNFAREYVELQLRGTLWQPDASRQAGVDADGVIQSPIQRVAFTFKAILKVVRSSPERVVIHSDAFDSAYLVSGLARIPGALPRRVLKVFSVNSDRYRFFSRLDRILLPSQDRLCTNSEYSRRQLEHYDWLRRFDISVCYSAIDFDALDAVASETKLPITRKSRQATVGYVGSFDRRKQLDQFVRCAIAALSEAANLGLSLHFIVFGGAKTADQESYRDEVIATIEQSGFGQQIRFAGYCTTAQIMQHTDALLCPFRHEPFGRVVPEFLYLGLEVFVIRDGGLEEAGCGFARTLDGLDGSQLQQSFLDAMTEWLDVRDSVEPDITDRRRTLRAAFGAKAIVDRELQSYAPR